MPLDRFFDLATCHVCSFRTFQENLRVPLNGRLVLMTFQTQLRTHTLPMFATPHQLHHPPIVPMVLRLLLTLVSYPASILFLFAGQF